MAEYHYRKAAEIHPNNAVLLGCVGMVCALDHAGLIAFPTNWCPRPLSAVLIIKLL